MEKGPWLFGSDKTWWEDNCVERDIVFSHKLIQFDVFILPPFFISFLEMVSSDRNVTDRSVKPNIKHFFLKFLQRNANSPLQVSSNALWLQTHFSPSFCDCDWVFRPFSLRAGTIDPLFKLFLSCGEIDEEMSCWFKNWSFSANETRVIFHFGWIVDQFLAVVTLVTPCVFKPAVRTYSEY